MQSGASNQEEFYNLQEYLFYLQKNKDWATWLHLAKTTLEERKKQCVYDKLAKFDAHRLALEELDDNNRCPYGSPLQWKTCWKGS